MITVELMTNRTISRGKDNALYIGLGSNVGDREANLREAVARLERQGVVVVKMSSIYETEPVGFKEQPWFLNQVIEGRCEAVEAERILTKLLDVEKEMGRERGIINGPRIIDIDLLLVGGIVTGSVEEDLASLREKTPRPEAHDAIVPHPRMHERRFVLEPLCEIAPEVIHPVLKMTCRELLTSLQDPSIVRRYRPTCY